MKFEIKSRWSGSVLFSIETDTLKLAVEAAIKSGADLSGAILFRADLSGAYLSRANLSGADLYEADLSVANLYEANLSGAILSRANLFRANLSGANLFRANLSGADLFRAINAELVHAQTSITPEGNLVGWKQCRDKVIVKLLIPQKARRSNATGRKCRAEYATVLRVYGAEEGISLHDEKTVYRKGETVYCDKWEVNRWIECGGGIHFYLTRIEAERQ